jgi:hypothetical protein
MKSLYLASLLMIVISQQAAAVVGNSPKMDQLQAESIYYYHGHYYPYHHQGSYYPYCYHGHYYPHPAWRYGRWYYYQT